MKIQAILYNKLNNDTGNQVQCNVCSHKCIINENHCGICNLRKNINGTLFNYSYSVVSSLNVDPIEKKPLYHFLPSSLTYSVGGFGCNMKCLNCQNHSISQTFPKVVDDYTIAPERIVENAIDHSCPSISFTYNEPTMFLEYSLKVSSASKKNNLKNIYVSNGYMTKESLDLLIPNLDAFNIDLKSISDEFYQDISRARVDPVLDSLKYIYKSKKHLEITNLLINKLNNDKESIEYLVDFIVSELGKEVPIHFSRFYPLYKMENIPPTDEESMFLAKEIAIEKGMDYVYLGNIQADQNSYCPNCGELLIARSFFSSENLNKIKNNRCINCNYKLNFVL
ncbi:MAG: AmmeMemoRadiSam system radical SAM enzyme [Methanobrevibacter sp.]|jgi:pyruvate formate lyase activating enzyme|nr:AmmeMemoRadiSam system radical SAM enzyme [Methanobrevibacter sp.]